MSLDNCPDFSQKEVNIWALLFVIPFYLEIIRTCYLIPGRQLRRATILTKRVGI